MDVKLNVPERLVVLDVLPREGNYVTLRLLRELNGKIGLSADEIKDFDVKYVPLENGQMTVSWNSKGIEEKVIQFKEKESDLIKEALSSLNKDLKLEERHFTIYEKFVEAKEV